MHPPVPPPWSGAYVPIGPTRAADTRDASCGCTRLDADTITVAITGRADVPDDAIAVAVIVTATPTPTPGFVTAYASGTTRPLASTLNTRADRVVANATIVPVGSDGAIALFTSNGGDVVVDITGAFTAADTSRAGRFVPVAARRLVDTRAGLPVAGPIGPGGELTIPLPAEARERRGRARRHRHQRRRREPRLPLEPAGRHRTDRHLVPQRQRVGPGRRRHRDPAGVGGRSHDRRAPPRPGRRRPARLVHRARARPTPTPGCSCRSLPAGLLDTRATPPRAWPGGTVELAVDVPGAGSLVTNVTATYADRAGFVTAFPAGTPLPPVSTLNPAMHDHTLANLAVTQVSDRGVAYFARSGADVVVD